MSKQIDGKTLNEHLREHISFMQASAKLYDLGTEAEAKRMAVSLRVLLYDSAASHSILGQMQLKKKLQFVSTAQSYSPTNLLSQQCLLSITIDNGSARYVPLFENDNRYKLLSCKDWNDEVVLSDAKHHLYRRKHVFSLLANMDGGAHVDPEINDEYALMKTPSLTGGIITDGNGRERPFDNDPVYATMRQMTFEVLQTLYRAKPTLFSDLYF